MAVPSFVKGNPEVQSSLGYTQRGSPAVRDDLDAFYAEEESEGEGETEGSEATESGDAPEVNLKWLLMCTTCFLPRLMTILCVFEFLQYLQKWYALTTSGDGN